MDIAFMFKGQYLSVFAYAQHYNANGLIARHTRLTVTLLMLHQSDHPTQQLMHPRWLSASELAVTVTKVLPKQSEE